MRWVCHTHNKVYGSVTDTLMIQRTYGVLSIQCVKHTTFYTVYLLRMVKNCQENRPVVYLNETQANAHDDKDCDWVKRDDVTGETLGGIERPPGKGCTAYYSWSWL